MAECPSSAHGTSADPYGCYEREQQYLAKIARAVGGPTGPPAPEKAQPDPCRRWSAYVKVQSRQRGLELEWRRQPRYWEVRLVGVGHNRILTFYAVPRRI